MLLKRLIQTVLLLAMVPVLADSDEDILARIKPIGQVQIEGQSVTKKKSAATDSVQKGGDKGLLKTGASVYQRYCIACHQQGLLGAPKVHNQKDWESRKKQGIDTLLQHVSQGFKAMPAKGTCFSCHDKDLKAAIYYMMSKDD